MQSKTTTKKSIYVLLDRIKKRPGFYLTSPTLDSLQNFLLGLSLGQHFCHTSGNTEPSFGEFSAWFLFHHKVPTAGAGGWRSALKSQSSNEREAFDRFFEQIEAYRQRTPAVQYDFKPTSAQRQLYATNSRNVQLGRLRLTRYKGERCLFLHALQPGRDDWFLHTGFTSLAQARPFLARVFGIMPAQWKKR